MAGQKNPAKVFQVQERREGQPEAPSWRNDYERPMALATHCPTTSWEQRARMGVLMGGVLKKPKLTRRKAASENEGGLCHSRPHGAELVSDLAGPQL